MIFFASETASESADIYAGEFLGAAANLRAARIAAAITMSAFLLCSSIVDKIGGSRIIPPPPSLDLYQKQSKRTKSENKCGLKEKARTEARAQFNYFLQPEQSAQQSADGQHIVAAVAVPTSPRVITASNTTALIVFTIFLL